MRGSFRALFSRLEINKKWPGFLPEEDDNNKKQGLPEIYPDWVDETMKIGGLLLNL